MGGTPSKPTTEAGWAKRVNGTNKVQRPASLWNQIQICPCSRLEKMFPDDPACDVFTVRSAYTVLRFVMALQCTMTIYRASDGSITLINVFRVPPAVEEEILALGPVKNIVTLGAFHGASDAYYLKNPKFGAPQHWTHSGSHVAQGLPAPLVLDNDKLVLGCKVVHLKSHYPECVITLPLSSGGNVLVTADALTHSFETKGLPPIGRIALNALGLATEGVPKPAPLWCGHQIVSVGADGMRPFFDEVMQNLSWRSVVTAHGPALDTCDHENVREAIEAALSK